MDHRLACRPADSRRRNGVPRVLKRQTRVRRTQPAAGGVCRQAIGITRAAADYGRTIRLSVHVIESLNRLTRARTELFKELGREPRPRELATRMGVPVGKAMAPLNDREREVLRLRYGLGADRELTLEEIRPAI
ncbi:MAG: hypothetical protein HY655_15165 [Acidobacteria bacterium]|nr:hypothetical protein [Acidobacteriota bacterium]